MTQNMPDFYSDLTEGGAEWVRVNIIRIFPRLGQFRVKASYLWGVIRAHIKIPQKFRSAEFLGVIPQKETLVQHQKYTWMLLIGTEYLLVINLSRGDTLYNKYYIYKAEGLRNSFLILHKKIKGNQIHTFPPFGKYLLAK